MYLINQSIKLMKFNERMKVNERSKSNQKQTIQSILSSFQYSSVWWLTNWSCNKDNCEVRLNEIENSLTVEKHVHLNRIWIYRQLVSQSWLRTKPNSRNVVKWLKVKRGNQHHSNPENDLQQNKQTKSQRTSSPNCSPGNSWATTNVWHKERRKKRNKGPNVFGLPCFSHDCAVSVCLIIVDLEASMSSFISKWNGESLMWRPSRVTSIL